MAIGMDINLFFRCDQMVRTKKAGGLITCVNSQSKTGKKSEHEEQGNHGPDLVVSGVFTANIDSGCSRSRYFYLLT